MRLTRQLLATAVAAVATTFAGGVAAAASADEVPDIETTDARAAEIDAAAAAAPSADLLDAEDAFLVEQARAGNPIDSENVQSAEVDDALVIWEDGVDVTRVQTAETSGTDDALEMSTEIAPGEESVDSGVADSGLGLDNVINRNGGSPNGGYCTTTIVSEQNLTQCFERFRIIYDNNPDRYTYFYNRWATAIGEDNPTNLFDWKPRKIDIRSRPWAGKRADFATLLNYWPRATTNSCATNSFSVGVKDFSATVPVWNCEGVTPVVNATSITAGAIWDGGYAFDQRSEGVDFAMAFTTFNKPAPMGDYGYAKFCKSTDATCEGVLRKDGW